MGHSDNIPGNVNTNEIDLNNGGWIIIAILICLVIVLFAIALYIHLKNQKTISKLKDFNKTELSDEERELIIQYRNLNNNDKAIIKDTLKNLSINHKDNKEQNAGRN